MDEEIGTTAGKIWQALNSKDELAMSQLKKTVGVESPIFDWAIGWLAREGKIAITTEKRTLRVRLK